MSGRLALQALPKGGRADTAHCFLGYLGPMPAPNKFLAASLTALLLLGGGATACGDEGGEGDMGDMEMNEDE